MFVQEKKVDYKSAEYYFDAAMVRITRTKPHFHETDLELIYCLAGEVHVTAGHGHTTLHAGDLVSVDFRDIHYIQSDAENLVLIFHMDFKRTPVPWERLEYQFLACETVHCSPYQQEAMRRVKDLVFALSKLCLTTDYTSAYDASAEKLVRTLAEDFNYLSYETQAEVFENQASERYERILAYCCQNYSRKITVTELARAEHIDPNYFSRFIKNTIFMNFDTMLKFIRCYEAERLLLMTDMPNVEIAYQCGFSSPRYFYLAFQSWWGCSPGEHRKRYQEYMKLPPQMVQLPAPEAAALLDTYISKWHVKKALTG